MIASTPAANKTREVVFIYFPRASTDLFHLRPRFQEHATRALDSGAQRDLERLDQAFDLRGCRVMHEREPRSSTRRIDAHRLEQSHRIEISITDHVAALCEASR